ncbi:MAG: carbohydrate kinase family protein [Actinomycetota bacterium]
MNAPRLIVAGTPSLDRIEIGGRVLATVGGSGFITAVAARLADITVGLIARVPKALPAEVAVAFAPGGIDPSGLVATNGSLPRFHISYDDSEAASYLAIDSGEESQVGAVDVPRRWLDTDWFHIGPLAASAARQLRFVEGLLGRGYRGGLSAGTFSRAAATEPDTVRRLFDLVDIAFMNQSEADQIYPEGPPAETMVFVTEGRAGVRAWNGSDWAHHPTTGVSAFDPTGAGDAFIGGYLGTMLSGESDPVERGLGTAFEIVAGPGAAPLIHKLRFGTVVEPDTVPTDSRAAAVDVEQTAAVAAALPDVASDSSLDFCGAPFPERDAPHALDALTVGTLHQYGFWIDTDNGYGGPMWATIDGVRRKGSDFIWHAFTRAAADDPAVLEPERLASDPLLFDTICVDDDGVCPVPDVGSHRALQQAYGATIGPLGGVAAIVERSNEAPDPLAALLETLQTVPGFGEDPLAKKANLLALILARRPERFLRPHATEAVAPIVDYHIMRTMLRTGCAGVEDAALREHLEGRTWVSPGIEASVRIAARDAINRLCTTSGLSVGAVDGFLFTLGRTVCLETEPPKCSACPIATACAQDVRLFQPIFRTTAY